MNNPPPLALAFPLALHVTVGLSAQTGPSEAIAWFIRLGQHLSGFDLELVVCGHTAAVLATDRALTVHDSRVLVNWLIDQPELSVARIGQLPPAAEIPAITRRPTNTPLQENDMHNHEPNLAFALWIEPRSGMPVGAGAQFLRRLHDHAAEHGLKFGGGPSCLLVWSAQRSLNATDQVELLDWLVGDPAVSAVTVGPLTLGPPTRRPADPLGACLRVSVPDIALIGLSLLYRSRRIGAELYLQILAGPVRPALLH